MSDNVSTVPDASGTVHTYQNYVADLELPTMTTGTSEEYVERVASSFSLAMLPNPTWRIYFGEGPDRIPSDAPDSTRRRAYQSIIKKFLASASKPGVLLAEAGDFSVYASWWPPGSHDPPRSSEDFDEMERQGQPLNAASVRAIEELKFEQLWSKYGQEYWSLVVLGRDTTRPSVPGAVRAVLQPFIERAAAEEKPIWLVTTNERAKDIYLHFGWQVVGTVAIAGFTQWCMILYPPVSSNP